MDILVGTRYRYVIARQQLAPTGLFFAPAAKSMVLIVRALWMRYYSTIIEPLSRHIRWGHKKANAVQKGKHS